MNRTKARLLVLMVATGLGCTTPMETIRARAIERAAFDLGCPAESLTTVKIGDTTRIGASPNTPGVERTVVGVSGCSKKAVYVVECVVGSCNAQLNADTKATE